MELEGCDAIGKVPSRRVHYFGLLWYVSVWLYTDFPYLCSVACPIHTQKPIALNSEQQQVIKKIKLDTAAGT